MKSTSNQKGQGDSLAAESATQGGKAQQESTAVQPVAEPSLGKQRRLESSFQDDPQAKVLRLVDNLNVRYSFERSLKMTEGRMLPERLLVGFKKRALSWRPHESILEICEELRMPEQLLRAFADELPEAGYVHFGVEKKAKTCIFKAYLEFFEKFEKKLQQGAGRPEKFLIHLGFKWDPSNDGRPVVTRYHWYPFISEQRIRANLAQRLDPSQNAFALEIANEVLSLCLKRIPAHDVFYLDVTEEDATRKSFDINFYRAGLALLDLYTVLSRMCRHYRVDEQGFRSFYDGAKRGRFGHLAGGIDRQGHDFLTVYHGLEYRGENKRNKRGE